MPNKVESVIKLAGVSKQFNNGTLALDNVTLEVPEGQLLCLIGLSGSGKSTLLRHINGLHQPTSGVVSVFGSDLSLVNTKSLRSIRHRVGFVFQQFGLVGRSTCIENVLSGALGALKGPRFGVRMYSKELRKLALENLDRVGIAEKAFQRADTLSGGQMQRVAIARSLMQQPKILLADEPVASLDPEISGQILELLMQIASEEQMTVVCTLHQLELALGWADRIVGLRDGKIVLDRPAGDLQQNEAMEVYRRTVVAELSHLPVDSARQSTQILAV